MSERISRRTILGGSAAIAIAGLTANTTGAVAAQPAVSSSGLGLSEVEIASIYGPGSPGQSFMYYTDPVYGVDLHIGYDGDASDYIWMALRDEQTFTGLPVDDSWQLALSLVPSDAQLRDSYVSPESPGTLAQVETARYTSQWLGTVLLRDSILVTIVSVPNQGGMQALRGMIQVAQR